jgi:hypothetical protein
MWKVLLFLVKYYSRSVTTLEKRYAAPDLDFYHDKILNPTLTEGSKSLK